MGYEQLQVRRDYELFDQPRAPERLVTVLADGWIGEQAADQAWPGLPEGGLCFRESLECSRFRLARDQFRRQGSTET